MPRNSQLIYKNGRSTLIQGIVFILLGGATIIFPQAFGKGLEILLMLLFFFLGIGHLSNAVQSYPHPSWTSFAINAALSFFVLILLAMFPLSGIFTISFLLMLFLFLDGIFKIIQTVNFWNTSGSGWVLLSGCFSLFIAVVMLAGFPQSAALVFSTFFGICLIVIGLGMVLLGQFLKRTAQHLKNGEDDDDDSQNQIDIE
ncbi:MAG: DUF308 domain-containing protein [Chlamydiia bacterium]|nr:DUF308 domain-containing protein [Chlamydiia bacterium]